MPDDRKKVGNAVEKMVKGRLEAAGYVHLDSNWRYGHGELDLVMLDHDELVFVEVKARRTDFAGRAEEGVSKKQAGILLRTAEMYTVLHPDVEGKIWRIDLVAVTLAGDGSVADFTHYENAIVVG